MLDLKATLTSYVTVTKNMANYLLTTNASHNGKLPKLLTLPRQKRPIQSKHELGERKSTYLIYDRDTQ